MVKLQGLSEVMVLGDLQGGKRPSKQGLLQEMG